MIDHEVRDEHGLIVNNPGAMTTITGKVHDPITMGPEDVCIEDIAHALSRQCRYNGHVTGFFSVARHSLWVADHLAAEQPWLVVLTGLLHDAAEAYLGDMIRPLKHGPLGEQYSVVEAHVESVIAEVFGLPYPFPGVISQADNWVLINEELSEGGARETWSTTPDQDKHDFLTYYNLAIEGVRLESS